MLQAWLSPSLQASAIVATLLRVVSALLLLTPVYAGQTVYYVQTLQWAASVPGTAIAAGTVTIKTTAVPSMNFPGGTSNCPSSQGQCSFIIVNAPITATITFTPTGGTKPVETVIAECNAPAKCIIVTPDAPGMRIT